jgi:hypothetical protein
MTNFVTNNNNKRSGRREKKRKKIISAQFRWSSERSSEQRSQEAPRRQVGKIWEENPFFVLPPSHPLTRHTKGGTLKEGLIPTH